MASSDLNIGPTSPVSPTSATRALTRITPVAPQAITEPEISPLGRSGLNIRELFNAPDEVVVRSRTPAVALELGLEQARGSMVRNQPADALATLDEVWSGARHTETGWYLRGGSLALLGLPGEASRVATEALQANPQSSANHFLQSLAKLTLGDVAAAQLSLENAAANSEPEPLLLIQNALIEAQRGNVDAAEELLRRAAKDWPDHPALFYGRDMMRDVLRNGSREWQKTAAQTMRAPINEAPFRTPSSARTPVSSLVYAGDAIRSATEDRAHALDIAADALNELGAALAQGTKRAALNESRALLGSLSAGGSLSNSISAPRAHAMRVVVGAILEALNDSAQADGVGWLAESVDGQWQRSHERTAMIAGGDALSASTNETLRTAVRLLVAALRENRVDDADAQLRRARPSLGETTFTMLRSVLGAGDKSARLADIDETHAQAAHAAYKNVGLEVQEHAPAHALLAPLRLGLALLPDDELPGSGVRSASNVDVVNPYAAAMASSFGDERRNVFRPGGSAGSLVTAIGLEALAVLAFANSHPAAAVTLAVVGGWIALRKGSQGARL